MSNNLASNISKESPDMLSKMLPGDRYRLIGEVATLLIASELHSKYTLSDIETEFMVPIDLNQFRIYKVNEEAVALITWAFLSEEVEHLYVNTDYCLEPKDWKSGNRIWMVDFLAPFGHAKSVFKDLKQNIFPNDVGSSIRVDEHGNFKSVYRFHGANVAKSFKKKSGV